MLVVRSGGERKTTVGGVEKLKFSQLARIGEEVSVSSSTSKTEMSKREKVKDGSSGFIIRLLSESERLKNQDS